MLDVASVVHHCERRVQRYSYMAVFGYIRVSTARQAETGLSLDSQKHQITAYCLGKQLGDVSWFQDTDVSGSTDLAARKAGSQLLERAKKGDIIVCAKLDRMFRNAQNALNMLAEFKKRGISLHFIDLGGDVSNGIGQLVFTILSAVAEQERERIRERIADVKLTMRREKRYQGGNVAFGYRVGQNGKLVKDAKQQRCIAVMREKRKAGMSLRDISQYLAENHGVSISHNAVSELLSGKRKMAL